MYRSPKRSWSFVTILLELIHTIAWSIIRDSLSRKCILENFQTPWNSKAGKSTSKTKVCSKTADPHLTMQWIKEVEIAKSIGELVTSRSIVEGSDFPDYDMLDAMIASALKKLLDQHVHFRRRVSVEEQRAQKYGDLRACSCHRSL